MSLLTDTEWHDLRELSAVARFPGEWVRELLLEDRVEVSTERETLAPLVRLRPIPVTGTCSQGVKASTTGVNALGHVKGNRLHAWCRRAIQVSAGRCEIVVRTTTRTVTNAGWYEHADPWPSEVRFLLGNSP
jgi:hypothetical protein